MAPFFTTLSDVNPEENTTIVVTSTPWLGAVDGSLWNAETCLKRAKRGKKPVKSINLYKKCLPSAMSKLLEYCKELYKLALNEDKMQLNDLHVVGSTSGSLVPYGSQEDQLDSNDSANTVAIKYTGKDQSYIELSSKVFSFYRREWIKIASNCYVLRTSKESTMHQPFGEDGNLDVVEENDGDEIFDGVEGVQPSGGLERDSRPNQKQFDSVIWSVDEDVGEELEMMIIVLCTDFSETIPIISSILINKRNGIFDRI